MTAAVFWIVVVALVILAIWWLGFTPSGQKLMQRWQDEEAAKKSAKITQGRVKERGLNLDAPLGTVTICTYNEGQMAELQRDISDATAKGWHVEQVTEKAGHINIGRTVAKASVGLVVFGASRTKGITVMRFTRVSK